MPIIQVTNLTKSFSNLNALTDINFSVERGDIFGIIGQSGAGKSTLIRCLATLEKPSGGSILINGCNIATMASCDLRSCRKNIGMIFQHFNLLSGRTVRENIAYPLEIQGYSKEAIDKRVEEMLDLVDLSNKGDAYPAKLSGGQKQRVGIARALAAKPEVLLCDEATSALDPKTTRDILALLKRLNKELNLTIVLITHEMDVVKELCTKLAVIDKGRIVETGSIVDIFRDPKHPVTKEFLRYATHEIPTEIFKRASPRGILLRLSFKGNEAKEPVISQMIKRYGVDVNILYGWSELVQGILIGNLVVDITGEEQMKNEARTFLQQNEIHMELL